MKYTVLVTKHNDGFCMFESKMIDYNIMATPYGKNIAKELDDACHRNGLKL